MSTPSFGGCGRPRQSRSRGSEPLIPPSRLSIGALRHGLESGRLGPAEAVVSAAAGAAAINPSTNAFVEICPSRESPGTAPRGPLAGVPVAVKDLFFDGARAPTAGSLVQPQRHARTASVLTRLRAAGAVVVGYTNLHEWALGTTSAVTATGPIHNPLDAARIAGGSSGGSAAALAAGIVPAAVGTDAAGSIRIPAACCGVVGLKPTRGGVPTDGFAGGAGPTDVVGPMARTVADARIVYEVMAGRQSEIVAPSSIRVGIATALFWDDVTSDVGDALGPVLASLSASGSVTEVDISRAAEAGPASSTLVLAHAARALAEPLRTTPQRFQPLTLKALQRGRAFSPAQVERAQETAAGVSRAWEDVFRSVDVVVTPTLPCLPPRIEEAVVSLPSGERRVDEAFIALNAPMSLAGLPCLSLPCAASRGWPVNVSITGPPGSEGVLLSVGEVLERASETG